jgi:lysophospholipase L1-like esterase
VGSLTHKVKSGKVIIKPYNVILVHVGTNNIHLNSIQAFKSQYHHLLSTITNKNPHAKLLLSAIIPRPVDHMSHGNVVKSCNLAISQLASQFKGQYLKTFRPFQKNGIPNHLLYTPKDKLHLNFAGTRKLTNFFSQVVAHS